MKCTFLRFFHEFTLETVKLYQFSREREPNNNNKNKKNNLLTPRYTINICVRVCVWCVCAAVPAGLPAACLPAPAGGPRPGVAARGGQRPARASFMLSITILIERITPRHRAKRPPALA